MDHLNPLFVIEVGGVLTGLACVWLYIRQNVWSWPLTIVSATLFGILFLDSRLYANAGLQGFFIALAAYGWYQWLRGGAEGTGISVSRLTRKTALTLLVIVAAATVFLFRMLGALTDAALPLWDSLPTAMSLAAQWMLARKILENWLVWIAADVIFVGVYISSGLYATAAFFVVLVAMALAGWLQWRRTLQCASS